MPFIKSNKLDVDKISEGQYLDRAKEIEVEDFFAKRMNNKVRKALVGNWLILIESEGFTYIGRPRFKSLFSNKRITEQLLKVNTAQLNQRFPSYHQTQGNDVRLQVHQLLYQELNSPIAWLTWKATLQPNYLSITANCALQKAETTSLKFLLHLDSDTLALMHLEKLT